MFLQSFLFYLYLLQLSHLLTDYKTSNNVEIYLF